MSSGSGVPIEFIMSVFFLPLRKGKKVLFGCIFDAADPFVQIIGSYPDNIIVHCVNWTALFCFFACRRLISSASETALFSGCAGEKCVIAESEEKI